MRLKARFVALVWMGLAGLPGGVLAAVPSVDGVALDRALLLRTMEICDPIDDVVLENDCILAYAAAGQTDMGAVLSRCDGNTFEERNACYRAGFAYIRGHEIKPDAASYNIYRANLILAMCTSLEDWRKRQSCFLGAIEETGFERGFTEYARERIKKFSAQCMEENDSFFWNILRKSEKAYSLCMEDVLRDLLRLPAREGRDEDEDKDSVSEETPPPSEFGPRS
jgi:hypothetical protein